MAILSSYHQSKLNVIFLSSYLSTYDENHTTFAVFTLAGA